MSMYMNDDVYLNVSNQPELATVICRGVASTALDMVLASCEVFAQQYWDAVWMVEHGYREVLSAKTRLDSTR